MVREPISKIKDWQVAGLSGVVSEMVKTAREAGAEMIADIVNQIIIGRMS